jgi:hypothetical protein
MLSPQLIGSPILTTAGIYPLSINRNNNGEHVMNEYVKAFATACTNIDPLAAVISFLAIMFIFMMWRATVKGKLDWQDMITSKGGNKVSLTKVLQLVGGVTGTWMMVYLTIKGSVSSDFFFTYLAYVGAIEGWSKFIAAKYSGSSSPNGQARLSAYDNGMGDSYAMADQYPPTRPVVHQSPRQQPPRYPPVGEPMSPRVPPESDLG